MKSTLSVMGKVMRWIKIITLTVGVTLLAFCLYYPFSEAEQQARNMKRAREHIPKVEPLLKADRRFSQVNAGVFTGAGGAELINGFVKSDQDLVDLKQLVNSTSPPVKVLFAVVVDPYYEELDRPTTEP